MSQSALSALFEYLCYGSMAIRDSLLFQWDRLYTSDSDYGVSSSVLAITEVTQRRARSIIGWVTAWICQYHVLYTLGHAGSDVVS